MLPCKPHDEGGNKQSLRFKEVQYSIWLLFWLFDIRNRIYYIAI